MNWTDKHWQTWSELGDWSHKVAQVGAEKLIEHAGLSGQLSSGAIFNIQDDVAYAIRRGAIRLLNELNDGGDTGEF